MGFERVRIASEVNLRAKDISQELRQYQATEMALSYRAAPCVSQQRVKLPSEDEIIHGLLCTIRCEHSVACLTLTDGRRGLEVPGDLGAAAAELCNENCGARRLIMLALSFSGQK